MLSLCKTANAYMKKYYNGSMWCMLRTIETICEMARQGLLIRTISMHCTITPDYIHTVFINYSI